MRIWLEVKLAWRMLRRHPGLTIVAGLALAAGIPISLAPVQLALALNAPLPFDQADRIVGLEYLQAPAWHDRTPAITDFDRWKSELTSFESLAAARRRSFNVIGEDGRVEVLSGAEMTAAGFVVTRVTPRLGRLWVDADERSGAEPVVVIGDEVWQTFFGAAPDAIGRTLQIGRTRRTVIGVMPAGFFFPYREKLWMPFEGRAVYPFGQGPLVRVFGRLRDGVSRDAAQAEFAAIGEQIAAEHPETHGFVRADIADIAHVITGLSPNTPSSYLLSLLLLAATCANVGTLMLARTATRSNEIAVRNALGASRSRIVVHLFVETLLLATAAGAVGLVLAELATRPLQIFEAAMPFWFDLSVKPATMVATAGLVLFSAVIAGLLPALKATRTRVYPTLQRQQGGGAGVRFGAAATVLIVVEVAVAVGGLSGVATVARSGWRDRSLGEGLAAEQYLTSQLRVIPVEAQAAMTEQSLVEDSKRLAAVHDEVERRLLAEPVVRAVSFASALPGMPHERAQIEVEGVRAADTPAVHVINRAFVDRGFFTALQQRVSGRDFETSDLAVRGRPVIVNRSLVAELKLGATYGVGATYGSVIGRRIRYVRPHDQPQGPWHEIIGVVNDLGMNVVDPLKSAGVYHVIAPGQAATPQLLVRVAGDAEAFVPRLRMILTSVEPDAVLNNPVRLDRVFSELLWQARFSSVVFTLVAAIAVVLSAAGLYALMAIAVTQRTREIAIRAALGARPAGVVRLVTTRALVQLAAGVVAGAGLAMWIVPEVLESLRMTADWRPMMIAVAVAMVVIGVLACLVPTRRALRIEPSLALKE
jgi:predicted permease